MEHESGEERAPSGGLLASAKRLLGGLVASAQTRLEMVALDIQAEQARVIEQIVLAVAAVFLASMSILLLTLLFVVAVWDTAARLPVLGGLTALYWIGAVLCVLALRRRRRNRSRLFGTTLSELRKDWESLLGRGQ